MVRDFEQYTKTEKYLLHNGDNAQGTREKTLSSFRTKNSTLHDWLMEKMTQKFGKTCFVSGQQLIDSSGVQGSKPADRYQNVLNRLLENYYRDNKLAEGFKTQQNGNILKEANRKKAPANGGRVEEPPVTYKPGKGSKYSVIAKQNELEAYLKDVRNKMEKIVKENKKVFWNNSQ